VTALNRDNLISADSLCGELTASRYAAADALARFRADSR
jgi:hypothetical protein